MIPLSRPAVPIAALHASEGVVVVAATCLAPPSAPSAPDIIDMRGPESPLQKRATERGVEDPVWAENRPKMGFLANSQSEFPIMFPLGYLSGTEWGFVGLRPRAPPAQARLSGREEWRENCRGEARRGKAEKLVEARR